MSHWLEIDGHIVTPLREGVREVLSTVPTGSEDGPFVTDVRPDWWGITGSLRDMDEEDVPQVRDWFVEVCQRLRATEAEMMIKGYEFTYVYELLDDGVVRLRPREWESWAWS